jgi:cytochrome c
MRYRLLLSPLILLLFTACDQMHDDRAIDQKSMDLARINGCLNCHALHEPRIGPPWDKVAERYGNTSAARELLIEKVKKGGSGSWTKLTSGAVMPPNSPRVADKDIEKLVTFILSLKSEKK